MKIRVANEIRPRHYSFGTLVQQVSLECIRDSEKSTGDTTRTVKAIVCDS